MFASVDDATRCWIKGRKFSLAGLLADPTVAGGVAPSPDSSSSKAARGSSKASSGTATPTPAAASGAAMPAGDGGAASAADAKGSSSSMGGSSGEAEGAAAAGALSATAGLAEQFNGGSMAIFRLAPQDYHRWELGGAGIQSWGWRRTCPNEGQTHIPACSVFCPSLPVPEPA